MSKPKFTPGPWEVAYGLSTIWIENNERIEVANVEVFPTIEDPEGTQEANARLIAAAPEMYDLLKQFCDGMQECESEYDKSGVASSMFVPFQEVLAKIHQDETDKV